ncbi:ABC transporter ATP-binding protein [Mycoplasmoides alvi]|uniref:ABC transporter ATP-binding protein n=1 Tax=Mycoplasmoides alvi TaxID=78580 RepID=UPI00069822E1|nr:ABC transporter ATP-binding protein [Mycoplasmoides alvi]
MNWFNKKTKKENYEIRDQNKFDINLELQLEKINAPIIIDKNMQHSGKSIIELKNLTKSFGKFKHSKVVVKDLNLTFYENENVALLGSNGAGKTTTVEMIAGIIQPTSGSIIYKFDYVNTFQEGVGIQFQDSLYPPGIIVADVIKFMINVYNVDLNPLEINQIVEAFGLKKIYKEKVHSLSGGQQQRLNILLALIHKPKIVFLDELSTGLDISVRTEIISFVKRYCEKFNIQIVLVSHNMDEVNEICDRIIIMQKGQIKVDLWTKDVIAKYNSVSDLAKRYI